MKYNIDFEIAAFIISFLTLAYYLASPKLKNRLSYLFFAIGIIATVVPVLNITALISDGVGQDPFIYSVNIFYQILLHALPLMSVFYILELTGNLTGLKYKYALAIIFPYFVLVLIILTNPFTGLVFYTDEGRFVAGPLIGIFYIVYFLYIGLCLFVMFSPNQKVRSKYKCTYIVMLMVQAASLCIQYLYPKYQVIDFSLSLSVLFTYIAMQPSAELTDPLTKALNYFALDSLLSDNINRKKPFIILGYSIDELRHINEVYGEDWGNELLTNISHTLSTAGQIARIYGNEFYVIIKGNKTTDEVYDFAEKLPKTFKIKNYEIPIGATIVIADSIYFKSSEMLIEFMEFNIRHLKDEAGEKILVIEKKQIDSFNRRQQVVNAVTRAVGEHQLDVYYQPIVDAYTGKMTGAEALARLNDPVLGWISPGEFIPVAEQTGLILELGKCVREKVWLLLSEYDIERAGLSYISVNLSSIECIQKTVMEEIVNESKKYNVKPELVAFEITESAAVASKEILAYNINTLRENGFKFYLDDYGTGYSSMSSLISLPFSVIKFEKSFIKLAMEPMRGDLVKRIISPMQVYGVRVIIEGIEDESLAGKARSWGVDYLQGFLYSEPLPKDAFIQYTGIEKKIKKSEKTKL